MLRFLISLLLLLSLSGCDVFVKRHPQEKQSFRNERSPSQNNIVALQAEDPKSGIIVPDPSEFTPNQKPKKEVPTLDPVLVAEYRDKNQTFYQLNNTDQVATFVQISKVEPNLHNPPKLNHMRDEITTELLKYETNYIEHPSDDFFAIGSKITEIPAQKHMNDSNMYKHDKYWRHHAPYYYDSQYVDSTRPYYLQDLDYVQQPAHIPASSYRHYPKMMRYEDEEWVILQTLNNDYDKYYGLKNHTKSRSILEYERFFSVD